MADNSQDNGQDDDKSNGSNDGGNGGTSSADASPVPPTVIGWFVRLASLALIIVLIGYLAYKGATEDDRFAYAIEPKWEEAQPGRNKDHLVPVEITNKSSRAIRNLQMQFSQGGGEPIDLNVQLVGPNEKLTYVIELDALNTPIETKIVYYEQ